MQASLGTMRSSFECHTSLRSHLQSLPRALAAVLDRAARALPAAHLLELMDLLVELLDSSFELSRLRTDTTKRFSRDGHKL